MEVFSYLRLQILQGSRFCNSNLEEKKKKKKKEEEEEMENGRHNDVPEDANERMCS